MKALRWLASFSLICAATPAQTPPPPNANGGPFVEQRSPRFVPASQADFMMDSERVVGVNQNGVAKAYAVRFMAFHHIIQDRLRDMPILVTW